MPFKRAPQVFSAAIRELTLGTGGKAIAVGGENVLPLYAFDGPLKNPPRVGIELSDRGPDLSLPELAAFYAGADSPAEQARRAAAAPGADFLSLYLESSDPTGADAPVEESVAFCLEIAAAVDLPLVIQGSGHAEKDAKLFEKAAEALQGKNALIMSAKEENYKGVSVAAVTAYGQKIAAESSVDINLAKQLNVLITQLGISGDKMAMNLGVSAAGYGFEYIASTIDRVRLAALSQNDAALQMPVVTPVAREAWGVKEAIVSEEDIPEWGPRERRGINMEVCTAAALIAAGSDAVILRHPRSVRVVADLIANIL
ncbi:MAG: acetyl-CoA decarbonylase/synthase complex subunit delta [Gracilibacteraceae bacterium]|jgi:acetyl-CoA decarbonylase/synthase complex subunit delta|nr:acetyl-CoA decarbonylase/synthase complex subunit delta [Gracilibacteraceae bacterium]